jgi:hypothetical protein
MTIFDKSWIFLKDVGYDEAKKVRNKWLPKEKWIPGGPSDGNFEPTPKKWLPESMSDPVTEGRMQPMAKVNPNVSTEIQEGNTQPDMDPSWTPEAIARINAENDASRRALEGE